MPGRPFTRAQALQNLAFLDALARTGNVRLAARELGVHRSTFTKRRARSAAFAAEWDAALAYATARLNAGQEPAPQGKGPRTAGGELVVTRLKSGRLQVRPAAPGRMKKAAEQAFLAALGATANIRLAARAAGFAHSSFYARASRNRAFAREMRLALSQGCERLEEALLAGSAPASYRDDGWRHNDPLPVPSMTAAEALHLLAQHWKTVKLGWEAPHRRRRRNETEAQYSLRLAAMWQAERNRAAELQALAEAAQGEGPDLCEGERLPHDPPPPVLPALDQVTGWSKAKPADPAAPRPPVARPLFGGWRLGDRGKRGG